MNYSMTLEQILTNLSVIDSNVDQLDRVDMAMPIDSLSNDSRTVTAGTLFFAYPGVVSDGRDYIQSAQERGASVIVYEAGSQLPNALTIPAFAVNGLQAIVGDIAHQFYQEPSTQLQVFGVTGTNGKTTCCYLLTQALEKLGMQAVMIGTIGTGSLSALDKSTHTTPDPISVHRLLAEFRDQGVTQVCMEVSSHALDQGRVNGVQFFCTLFTNLSHDHLDYHGDMGRYASAKRRLFTHFKSELVITNANDPMGAGLIDIANAQFIVSYGSGGDVLADDVVLSANGIELVIEGNGVEFELSTPLIGHVNVANIELLVATLLALSTSVEDIQSIVEALQPAPGRMDVLHAPNHPRVVIDYAHTPDALGKALASVKPHCEGVLWCVFGCGGDRDQAKRVLMGEAASQYADRIVITNDNPRSEDPKAIADEVLSGCSLDDDSCIDVVLDRSDAIAATISQAGVDDWVLLAGKGHETTQTISDQVLPFSDREHVVLALGLGE